MKIIIGKEYKLGSFSVRSSYFILATSSPFGPNTVPCIIISKTLSSKQPSKPYVHNYRNIVLVKII
jgi:hypothetical protein